MVEVDVAAGYLSELRNGMEGAGTPISRAMIYINRLAILIDYFHE